MLPEIIWQQQLEAKIVDEEPKARKLQKTYFKKQNKLKSKFLFGGNLGVDGKGRKISLKIRIQIAFISEDTFSSKGVLGQER